MQITLEQIQSLKAVKDSGSLNSASESLGKAKSALSYSLNKLEDQLGFILLDRSSYRIKLTQKADAFLIKALPLLKKSEELKSDILKIASGTEVRLSLSASAIYPTKKINSVMKNLIKKFPSTEFIFHREILSGEKMLLRGDVDIAIFENVQNDLDLDTKEIGTCDLKLSISSDHPFTRLSKKHQTLEELIKYPQIIQRSTIKDDNDIGIPDNAKRWTVSDIDSKKDLILEGLGWGRLPGHFINTELKSNKLTHLKNLNYDHKTTMYICKRKNKSFGPVLKFIWDSF